jgi:hypothetical protein
MLDFVLYFCLLYYLFKHFLETFGRLTIKKGESYNYLAIH